MFYTGSYSTITKKEADDFIKSLKKERAAMDGKAFPCDLCNHYALITTKYRDNKRKTTKKHFCIKFNKELSNLDGCNDFLYTFPATNKVFSLTDLQKTCKKCKN